MPEYHVQEVGGWKIETSPTEKWRRALRKLHLEPPYFVGDKVKLTFTFTKLKKDFKAISFDVALIAYYPQDEGQNPDYRMKEIPFLDKDVFEYPVESETCLSKDGVSRVYIAHRNFMSKSGKIEGERYPLFSTGVKHKDFVRWDIFLVLIGVLGGGICGCLSAFGLLFITVTPAWNMWIPEWIMRLLK